MSLVCIRCAALHKLLCRRVSDACVDVFKKCVVGITRLSENGSEEAATRRPGDVKLSVVSEGGQRQKP